MRDADPIATILTLRKVARQLRLSGGDDEAAEILETVADGLLLEQGERRSFLQSMIRTSTP